jgi:hypothetical protein
MVLITLVYLLFEHFFIKIYGTHLHVLIQEEYSLLYNLMNMFLFNFVSGFVVSVVIYFSMISDEVGSLLRERDALNEQLSAQKVWVAANDVSKSEITLGRTKDALIIKPANILYIEASGNYVDVHFVNENGKAVRKTIRSTIQQMEGALQAYPGIIRCHRAYIVNVSHVEKVNSNQQGLVLILKPIDKEVPVSRTYKKRLRHFKENEHSFVTAFQ